MTTVRIENPFPNVPPPAGAVEVCEWDDHLFNPDHRPSRYFVGTMRRVGPVEVLVDGTQWVDGSVELSLTVHGVDNDTSIPTDTARKIAAALIEAADELDGLTGV
jgi:hypothetical protein